MFKREGEGEDVKEGEGLNPFGTGKVFKQKKAQKKAQKKVLIPSEQGKCSNRNSPRREPRYLCLNPFGTGKVFKQIREIISYM